MNCSRWIILIIVFLLSSLSSFSSADQTIIAQKVDKSPVIDGDGTDHVWEFATEYTTMDKTAEIPVTIKALYTDEQIFFLVSYPDPDESVTHKALTWDKEEQIYKPGPEREDTFIFKWNMESRPVDLSVKSDDEFMADIWFWKAVRTDPVGYADDKYQQFSRTKQKKAKKVTSKSGQDMYLVRRGDEGASAYKNNIVVDYEKEKMPPFTLQDPTGSRADIKAKGKWAQGRWTIEFSRALDTGHEDDVAFDLTQSYLFGISRFEIAGSEPQPDIEQPLFNSGDISEALTLQFGEQELSQKSL